MFQPKILETKNTKILCEQKPINVDDFNDVEEKEVKERKRKQEETKWKKRTCGNVCVNWAMSSKRLKNPKRMLQKCLILL